MSLVNLKVGTRLGLGFGLVLFMMALIAFIGINRLSGVNDLTDTIVNKDWKKALIDNEVGDIANDNARATYELFLLTDKAALAKTVERINENKRKIDVRLEQLDELVYRPEGKALLATIKETRKPYVTSFGKVKKLLLEDNKREEASRVMVDETMPALSAYQDAINNLILFQGKIMTDSGKQAAASYELGRNMIIAIGALAVLLGIVIGWVITRGLLKQLGGEPDYAAEAVGKISSGDLSMNLALRAGDNSSLLYSLKTMQDNLRSIISNDVGRVLEAMSRGDLTEKISNDYPGVFGQLKDDANITVDKLTEIIAQVKDSTDVITTASQEIAQGNSDLSQRTEEQASSLEETASSMEELTSTVRQNAENAKQANQLSLSASDIALKGGKVVGEVVDTMASISDSSKKIVDIISVIEGIAFQTNILALNAAVEAARAGEQGRGFAVVAGEVRNLAQRSAAAAKEIKTLIDDSVGKVDAGSRQVDQAGATMSEIVTAVKRVADIMSEISAASNEQSAGIEQVNQAITQMDDVTQQNAALVEEAAAAAEAMQEQANALDTAMGTFKLDGRTGATVKHVAKLAAKPAISAPKAVVAHKQERKLARTRANKDGDWKEF